MAGCIYARLVHSLLLNTLNGYCCNDITVLITDNPNKDYNPTHIHPYTDQVSPSLGTYAHRLTSRNVSNRTHHVLAFHVLDDTPKLGAHYFACFFLIFTQTTLYGHSLLVSMAYPMESLSSRKRLSHEANSSTIQYTGWVGGRKTK